MRVRRHPYEVEGWGVGELWAAKGIVVAHEAPTPRRPCDGSAAPADPARDYFVPDLLQRIRSFFRGARETFGDVPLDLDGWTPFQRDVAHALRQVAWGEVISYGELAEAAGYPRAGRAVGTFCAHNPYFLLIPCHRVVAAAGIGAYGSLGVSYKRRLLRLEGHAAL